MGLLGVALCLLSCVLVMLLTLGAKALPQTHSVWERFQRSLLIHLAINNMFIFGPPAPAPPPLCLFKTSIVC